MSIPFLTAPRFVYGDAQRLSPRVRRLIAPNPGSFTFTGTGTYIIGDGRVAVIDPGPALDEHFDALLRELRGETVTHILVTHAHLDHSPLAERLAAHFNCLIYAGGRAERSGGQVRLEAGDDLDFTPDQIVGDGWSAIGPDWSLRAVETPGHTAHHLCFLLNEENALFSGDHIMSWSTSVVSPPDGNMTDYIDSLEKVRRLEPSTVYPAHGAQIASEVDRFIAATIEHRMVRDAAILAAVRDGASELTSIVRKVYTDIDPKLLPAACHSALAHLLSLAERGMIIMDGPGDARSRFFLLKTSEGRTCAA